MEWFNNLWKKPKEATIVDELSVPKVVDVMKDDVDPEEVTIENAYKTRWIWYHTILALELLMTNLLLLAILVTLAIKL
jgi:hypothetical protein